MRKRIFAFVILAVAVILAGPAFSQESKNEEQGFRKEVIRLKYVRADAAHQLLEPFLGREGSIRWHQAEPDIMTVMDRPENVQEIMAALKKIDVKPADVLFTVQLVQGSETEDKIDPELQNDPLIRELRKLLRYKGYTLLDTTLLRSVDGLRSEIVLGKKSDFRLRIVPEVAKDQVPAMIKVGITLAHYNRVIRKNDEGADTTSIDYQELIESNLNVKSGEKTVVGVSRLDGGDKGLILIVSGKVVD